MDATKLIAREGWDCAKCGHRHAGLTLANICVGCPCPETTPLDTAEDDWIRIASQNAQDAADRLKLLQGLYEKALDQRDSALVELTDTRRFWKAAKDALQAEKADNKGLRLETNIQRERNRELDEAHKRLIRDYERLLRAPGV